MKVLSEGLFILESFFINVCRAKQMFLSIINFETQVTFSTFNTACLFYSSIQQSLPMPISHKFYKIQQICEIEHSLGVRKLAYKM